MSLIDLTTTVFWFRRDLRLIDNAGLYYALKENRNVLPVFIFDTEILNELEDKNDKRLDFIYQAVLQMKGQLEELGSSLLIFQGNPVEFFKSITPKIVYANHDYEPYARARDTLVANHLKAKGSELKTYKDQVIFDRNEVMKDDGSPYTVFTPYSRKWKSTLNAFYLKNYPNEKYFGSLKKIQPLAEPSLKDLGFKKTSAIFPERLIRQTVIKKYAEFRNFPGLESTTRLGVHLRFGTISIRKLAQISRQKSETWLNELIWRDFYHMILWHFPDVDKAFKPAYDRVVWRNDAQEFKAWCDGRTGYPIVDAGMRELNETGFMHNRVRMIVASFLTRHLLIDWRWGEAYFAKKLLDFDLAANNGGWQWASGSGCDAAPYFRIFNPDLQTKKFDPHLTYIKKWVPEYNTSSYLKPIIDHNLARERALKAYKTALSGS